jgi:hypothetical protein
MNRAAVVIGAVVVALVVGGCGSDEPNAPRTTAAAAPPKACPAAWRTGWQQLADEVGVGVYCPTWMPEPLDGRLGSQYFNGRFVNGERDYLVSWAWVEAGATGTLEVHVNFRGYPGQTTVPVCEDTLTVNGKTTHPKIPCFSDKRGTKRFGTKRVTIYTANQGTDLWHILYAWRDRGTLYAVSEHVAQPYTYKQVEANLDRLMRGLVRVAPARS